MATRERILTKEGIWPQVRERMGRPLSNFGSFARRKPVAAASAIFLVAIILMTVGSPLIETHDPVATDTPHKLESPSLDHFFGTDDLGRDIWSRLVEGARVSLVVAYGATAFGVAVATGVALISGYMGGRVDLIIQRLVDAFMSVPVILFIMAVLTILEPTVWTLILTIGVFYAVRDSRLVRSAVLSVRVMPYIEAARALGASPMRIALRHILPNIIYVVIIAASLAVGQVILVEAIIGFLGFGIPPPTPTWGQMLSGTARTFMTQAPWMGLAPGIAISLTVLAFNMLGDGLRDVLDPKLRKAA